MADKPACAARLTASKPVGIGMSCWSSKQSRPRRSSRPPCLPISLAGKRRSPRTTPASRPAGRSMNGATANWRTWPRICSFCWRCSMTVGSSVEKTSPPSKPRGAWLHCTACGWNGARDYAASLNVARLGMAFLTTYHETWRYQSYRMTDSSVKPALCSRAGATLLLPSQGITPRPPEGKYVYYAGWSYATSLRTSHPKKMLALLSTSRFRKRLLRGA
jgi:hypothetical protein